MDSLTGAILTAGAVAITGITSWALTRAEPPHKECIRQCQLLYRPDSSQYSVDPEFARNVYMDCVRQCCSEKKAPELYKP